jgi:hypothetical protein
MAVVMYMEWPGVTADDYEALRRTVNWEGERPEGAIFHVSSFHEGQGRVVDVWDSEEQFHDFFQNRLMPEIQKLQDEGRMQGQPDVKFAPAHAIFAPAYERATV